MGRGVPGTNTPDSPGCCCPQSSSLQLLTMHGTPLLSALRDSCLRTQGAPAKYCHHPPSVLGPEVKEDCRLLLLLPRPLLINTGARQPQLHLWLDKIIRSDKLRNGRVRPPALAAGHHHHGDGCTRAAVTLPAVRLSQAAVDVVEILNAFIN